MKALYFHSDGFNTIPSYNEIAPKGCNQEMTSSPVKVKRRIALACVKFRLAKCENCSDNCCFTDVMSDLCPQSNSFPKSCGKFKD